MSYRTYVGTKEKGDIQILGNNEWYQPFIEELKRQGIEIDENGCYEGEIKEIQPILDILEQYIWSKEKEVKEIYDEDIFNLRPKAIDQGSLTFRMKLASENAYIFTTANIIRHLRDDLELKYDIYNKKEYYQIKEGKKIWFSAY